MVEASAGLSPARLLMKSPSKIFYADLETTGVDENANGIIQIAVILEKDKQLVDTYSTYVAPGPTDKIDEGALAVNGKTIEEIRDYPPPVVAGAALVSFLSKHINPYDPQDKWVFCGHNSSFDQKFLYKFFRKYTSLSLNNFVHSYLLDTYAMAQVLWLCGEFPEIKNLKLPTLAEHYKIEHRAHDAVSDTEVARQLFRIFFSKLGGEV